jgi:hypothetical protein
MADFETWIAQPPPTVCHTLGRRPADDRAKVMYNGVICKSGKGVRNTAPSTTPKR